MSRRSAEAPASASRGAGLRAGVATLAWGLASCVAFVLASAVLLRTLRADEAASPWRQWFAVADVVTPGILTEVAAPDWSWLRADAWDSAFGWALASLVWLVLGLAVALLVRPRATRPRRAVQAYSRSSPGTVPSEAPPGDGAALN